MAIEITVRTNPVNIDVIQQAGIQGPPGSIGDTSNLLPRNETGQFYPASNPSGFITSFSGYITTGQSDIRYYPLNSNPSGYITGLNGRIVSSNNLNLISNNNNTGIILSGGYISLYGNTSGISPMSSLLSLPVSEQVYGDTSYLLGAPIGWIDIYISGILRKLPYY